MNSETNNPLADLAEYIVSIRAGALPEAVRNAAVDCLIDTIGAGIGGVAYEEVPQVIATFLTYSGRDSSSPQSCVWGTRERTSVF